MRLSIQKKEMETLNKIFVKRKFNCSANDLFNWLSQPELIVQWFGPKHLSVDLVNTDIRLGGKYSIQLTKPNNKHFFIQGTYLEIDRPFSLVFSFRYEGLPSSPPESIVKISIEAISEDESQLFLSQNFVSLPVDMENRKKSWEYMFEVLGKKFKS